MDQWFTVQSEYISNGMLLGPTLHLFLCKILITNFDGRLEQTEQQTEQFSKLNNLWTAPM